MLTSNPLAVMLGSNADPNAKVTGCSQLKALPTSSIEAKYSDHFAGSHYFGKCAHKMTLLSGAHAALGLTQNSYICELLYLGCLFLTWPCA